MTSLEIVNKFYQLNNEIPSGRASVEDFKPLLADDFLFAGPLMEIEGADNYINLLRQFLGFHKSLEIVKQIANGNEICTITELKLNTPSGNELKMEIAEWIEVEDNKLKSHKIYYDPRAFNEAFQM